MVKDLQDCSDGWGQLAASSLDADAASLAQLAVLQEAMGSLARWLEMVCLKSSLQGSLYSNTEIEFQLPALPEGATANTIELQGIVATLQEADPG